MKGTLLIKNGIVITLGENNRVLHNHHVIIEDGKISKITDTIPSDLKFDKEIDAAGKLIMPGFINAHMHFYSTLVRGLGKAEPAHNFQEVLENLWWRLDKKLSMEDNYYSALVMMIQSIKCGTTTLIDHHASPGAVKGSLMEIAKAVTETGLRSSLCYELSDRDGKEIAQQGLEENEEFIKYCADNDKGFLKAMFGLHASFTVGEETLIKASEIGNKYNSGFHVHVAEDMSDQNATRDKYGLSVVERFRDFKILGKKSIAAHCIHIDEAEMDMLAETNTIVTHQPQSNMNNAVGISDIIKMQEKGILVGLGTDAMTVNMLEEVRTAMWAQHLRNADPSVGFMEVVNTLFFNNAKIANRFWDQKLGVIEEDAVADIVLLDYYSPTPLNEGTVLGHFIFGLSNAKVDTTIVNGRVLMENQILKIDIDEREVNAKAAEAAQKLWDRF
ncbi:MAG: putative aminohydrolase SsnA [Bacteroidetes bacterium]|nr:putative aminohydrolase SsnA [Bacteroidota bacterium]